jgi:hypothetical protein
MSSTTSVGNQQLSVFNSQMPKEGPKCVNLPLDFTEQTEITVDFTMASMQAIISLVQTLWVDNSQSAFPIEFTVTGTGQVIRVPAGAMAVLPVIAIAKPKIVVDSASGLIIPVLFLNVPLPSAVWSLSNTAGGPLLTEVINTPLPVLVQNFNNPQQISGTVQTQPEEGTPIAATASTITLGGTAQTLFGGNSIVNVGAVQNPVGATENLYVCGVGDANVTGTGSTFTLAAGQSFSCYPSTQDWTVNAVTTGHAFAAMSV